MKSFSCVLLFTLLIAAPLWQAIAQPVTKPLDGVRFSSNNPVYIKAIKKADSALNAKDYELAKTQFQKALKINKTSVKALCRYVEAQAATFKIDEAFGSLAEAEAIDWKLTCLYIGNHPNDYKNLQDDPRWKIFLQKCENSLAELEANLDTVLIDTLAIAFNRHKQYRNIIEQGAGMWNENTAELNRLIKLQQINDSLNIQILKPLIYAPSLLPGISKVRVVGTQTWLRILEVAPLAINNALQETILKMMEAKELQAADFANWYDIYLLRSGKKQLYGTQLQVNEQGYLQPYPLHEPKLVDKRRAAMRLKPLAEYIREQQSK